MSSLLRHVKRAVCLVSGIAAILVLAAASAGAVPQGDVILNYDGRDMYVHVPPHLPPEGSRALVVVLHGGMGNALRIASRRSQAGINLDATADRYGFIVAYMNGTPVTRLLGADKKGWNAGMCCGQSSANNIDDVGYISAAVRYLADKYAIDPARVFGIGHSNGAMMTQRIICETDLYAAGVSVSGALELKRDRCPGASGKAILAIHGENDTNVPIAGGAGKGISRKNYKNSQAYSKQVFENSGAKYDLLVLPGAAHELGTIEKAMEKTRGVTLAEAVARFFGLTP